MYPENYLESKEAAQMQPEGQAVDLFLRNFFIKNKMNQTLNNFQQEWYEMLEKGTMAEGVEKIPFEYEES